MGGLQLTAAVKARRLCVFEMLETYLVLREVSRLWRPARMRCRSISASEQTRVRTYASRKGSTTQSVGGQCAAGDEPEASHCGGVLGESIEATTGHLWRQEPVT